MYIHEQTDSFKISFNFSLVMIATLLIPKNGLVAAPSPFGFNLIFTDNKFADYSNSRCVERSFLDDY